MVEEGGRVGVVIRIWIINQYISEQYGQKISYMIASPTAISSKPPLSSSDFHCGHAPYPSVFDSNFPSVATHRPPSSPIPSPSRTCPPSSPRTTVAAGTERRRHLRARAGWDRRSSGRGRDAVGGCRARDWHAGCSSGGASPGRGSCAASKDHDGLIVCWGGMSR